jgi:hypothetical protein
MKHDSQTRNRIERAIAFERAVHSNAQLLP